ncbi:hypothetical protein MUP77_14780 [Candidatus Bathyarchaeota archaeon]|nr:hypothetical protein [Candidatus Bathyarchaeota archaeon]
MAHTKEIYGVEAVELHQWLDEPVKLLGPHHRDLRHDRLTLKNIPQKFIRELGERLAQDVIVDHFLLDKKPREKRSENSLLSGQQKQVIDYPEIVKKDEKKQLEKVDRLEPNQKKILELLTAHPDSTIMDAAKLLYPGQDIEYGGKQYMSTCQSFHMLEERGLIEKLILGN